MIHDIPEVSPNAAHSPDAVHEAQYDKTRVKGRFPHVVVVGSLREG
jgi:hypothetical protein